MLKHPPEILITTPESLHILLTSKNSFFFFNNIKTVILDEIHAIAGDKRGTLLISSVERLARISGEFQRIVLSATIRPVNLIADWAGSGREMNIVEASRSKKFEIKVDFPRKGDAKPEEDSNWPALVEEFKRLIKSRKSTLLFTNSRRAAEKTARLINENEPVIIAYSHHGSISKELRLEVEDKLKNGMLKAIVATSSLELGIDIGELDQVIMVSAPRSVSSALQRIGRAGHKAGLVSRGLLFPTHGRDFVDAAVIARAAQDYEIEPVRPVENPLDMLSQIILSMLCPDEWDIDELYDFIKTISPFRNLLRSQYALVLNMLSGRYAGSRIRELKPRIFIDKLKNRAGALEGAASLVYLSGGAIPDRGYYDLRVLDTHSKIGELDEEFVWERKVGDTFSLGPSVWRIMSITNNDVMASPAGGAPNIIPFWKAEDMDRGFFFFEKVGLFLEKAGQILNEGEKAFENLLIKDYSMTADSAGELYGFLKSQADFTKSELPGRHHILAEHVKAQAPGENGGLVLHTLWGGRVNRPFSFILSAAWRKIYGSPIEVMAGDDNILFMLPQNFKLNDIFELLYTADLEGLLKESLENTGYFGAHFRENAGRALLLPKRGFKSRVPLWLNRLRAKKLLEAVRTWNDFPVTIETWRECIQDVFELENLKKLLGEIRTGEIGITEINTPWPSPFCGNIIYQQKNKYIYEDDSPAPSGRPSLSDDIFREIISTSGLRPLIPPETVSQLDQKLKRTWPGYAPGNVSDLLEWAGERLLIPGREWEELITAAGLEQAGRLEGRLFSIKPPLSADRLICAAENLPLISMFCSLPPDSLDIASVPPGAEVPKGAVKDIFKKMSPGLGESSLSDRGRFFLQWISYYAALDTNLISGMTGLPGASIAEILEALTESGEVIIGKLIEGSDAVYVSERSNIEALLRILRRQRQPVFKALPIGNLQLYIASRQGLTAGPSGNSIEAMKKCLDRLFGFRAGAPAWEELIFPARLSPYFPAWLDSLLQNTGLLWFGCGREKLSFAFPEDLELFSSARGPGDAGILEDDKRYNFFELAKILKTDTGKASVKIWEMAWKGTLSSDSYESVRKGILNGFTASEIKEQGSAGSRGLRSRWESSRPLSGSWHALKVSRQPEDLLSRAEIEKNRARVLFDRYGIIFREILANEAPELRWGSLLKTLRLMEISGEILSGYFFEGIPGPQFASHEAYRELQQKLPGDSIYWLSAADPASLCGTGLKGLSEGYPKRIQSGIMVFHGERLVLTIGKGGRELVFHTGPDHPAIERYLDVIKALLTREFNPLQSVRVEKINGEPAGESPYRDALIRFGFKSSYKGLEIWRY